MFPRHLREPTPHSIGGPDATVCYPRQTVNLPQDPELVRRCLEGEEQAWQILTARYTDLVYGVARRSGISAADAGDVMQEVFLALLNNLSRLKRTERLMAWILKTARREAWRQVKRARDLHAREKAGAKNEEAPGPLPAESVLALEREHAVRTAFGALGERCRRLLDALYFREARPSYADVATDLGMPPGSLGPTRRRCLEQLERALKTLGFDSPEKVVSKKTQRPSRGARREKP